MDIRSTTASLTNAAADVPGSRLQQMPGRNLLATEPTKINGTDFSLPL
jgi:hypothetical protein